MVTPRKFPQLTAGCRRHGRSPRWRSCSRQSVLVATLFLPPLVRRRQGEATPPEPSLTSANAGELCLRLSGNPKEYISDEALRRRWDLRRASCNMAFAAHPENTHFKVAVARPCLMNKRRRPCTAARGRRARRCRGLLRNLRTSQVMGTRRPRQDAAGNPRRSRPGAAQSRRTRTSLFDADAGRAARPRRHRETRPAAARYWAERAVANPAKDESKGDLQVLLGRLLVTSDKPDERARGLDILERLAARRAVRRQARIGDRHPQGRSHAGANIARGSADVPTLAARRAARGNADRGRRRPGRPEARVVAVEGSSDTAGAKGVLGQALCSKANWCLVTSRRRYA